MSEQLSAVRFQLEDRVQADQAPSLTLPRAKGTHMGGNKAPPQEVGVQRRDGALHPSRIDPALLPGLAFMPRPTIGRGDHRPRRPSAAATIGLLLTGRAPS